jgi:hypothetical protein
MQKTCCMIGCSSATVKIATANSGCGGDPVLCKARRAHGRDHLQAAGGQIGQTGVGKGKRNEESSGPGNPGLTPRVVWLRESYGCANSTNPQNPRDIHESVQGGEEIVDRIRTFSYPVSPQRELRREVPQASLYAKQSDHKVLPIHNHRDRPHVRCRPGFRRVQFNNRNRLAVRSDQSLGTEIDEDR